MMKEKRNPYPYFFPVLPEYQNEGVGSKLIEEALKTARNLGF